MNIKAKGPDSPLDRVHKLVGEAKEAKQELSDHPLIGMLLAPRHPLVLGIVVVLFCMLLLGAS